jgi:hypothetical protein
MTNEELSVKLFEKAAKEQEEYRAALLSMQPKQILENAYQYVVREDILISLEHDSFNDKRVRALLKSQHPISDIYNQYIDIETGGMNGIRDAIEETANKRIREAKAKENRDVR